MKKIIGVIVAVLLVFIGVLIGMNVDKRADNKVIGEAQAETPIVVQNSQNSGKISLDEAKAIALKEAGLNNADFIKAKSDFDDGREIYDIEFRFEGKEWEYEIDAATGKVVSFDVDNNGKDIIAENGSITQTEAEDIALKSANVVRDNVVYINSKSDFDDGRNVYDVEFVANGKEYEYEINAATGEIISSDIDNR